MKRRPRTMLGLFLIVCSLLLPLGAGRAGAVEGDIPANQFVKRAGSELRLNGKPFRFAGTNNYYLMYKSPAMVGDVLEDAAAAGFDVVRMWGSLEIGNPDGSNSIHGKADGVYFQYWDAAAGRPAYNDGADGLEKLDYAVYRAGQLGLKLVIPFVNNWNAFGGMDQYVRWRGGQHHHDFYTDPVIRGWYRDWIAHLLNRTNTYTGVAYRNDPTIMTWELANEPRCLSAGVYPRSAGCSTETLTAWAAEMSAFVKRIDRNHLLSVGDEGFYCIPGAGDWTENCGEGVDTLALARLPHVDVLSLHLYPDHWGKDVGWGTRWIERHAADARALGKPAMLGEFGLLDKRTRNPDYQRWTDAVARSGMSGALYWILSGIEDGGGLYADYDGFTVYCPSPVCTTLSNFAATQAGAAADFAPVADHDSAVTAFETAVALSPAANDIAYGGASMLPESIDLDPAAAGRQSQRSVAGGSFAADAAGAVSFTPAAGFAGRAEASYTVADSAGRRSNVASLVVTVKPDPTAAIELFSFEAGAEGWAGGSWQGDPGSAEQSAGFATSGGYGLRVVSTGAWFGAEGFPTLSLAGKTALRYDLSAGPGGTSTSVALKLGDGWVWCQSSWGWVNGGTTTTVSVDLLDLGCANADLSKLQGIYIWFSAGEHQIDRVRAE